ncbi:MAG: sodium:calcium antiporter [Oscillospiraceae bacterium]
MQIYLLYALLVLVVVFLSIKIANYVDLLDKKTNLSGAFIGGVMLAAATSLPELFTSISAIKIIKNPSLVIGNIFGSNIFNLTILGCVFIFLNKKFILSKISKTHSLSILMVFLLTVILSVFPNITFSSINIKSLIIIFLYILVLKAISSDDCKCDSGPLTEKELKISVNKIYVMFFILSLGIIISSLALTYSSDIIAANLNLDASVAGALLLGVATSLPELVSSFQLCKIGNYNAVVGNIVGSNLFNLTILAFSDFLSNDNIYIISKGSKSLIILNLISTILVFFTLKIRQSKVTKLKSSFVLIFLGVLSVLCYGIFIVLGL